MKTYSGVKAHQKFAGGWKTVCTSTVLGALGIPPEAYHYGSTVARYSAVLRNHGYSVRSRDSHTKKATTVGAVRALLQKGGADKWGDPSSTKYLLRVVCGKETHLMTLGRDGETLVDTAPRKVDRRKVLKVLAVFPK